MWTAHCTGREHTPPRTLCSAPSLNPRFPMVSALLQLTLLEYPQVIHHNEYTRLPVVAVMVDNVLFYLGLVLEMSP